jgi:hypothetical protein
MARFQRNEFAGQVETPAWMTTIATSVGDSLKCHICWISTYCEGARAIDMHRGVI